jgi:hypothetical protein
MAELVMVAHNADQVPAVSLDRLEACRLLTDRVMRMKYA